jgi:hypothetical protein
MNPKIEKTSKLSDEDLRREKKITSKLNLKKLPFKVSKENFCSRYAEMFKEMTPLFKYKEEEYAMKWCLSTEKRMKVFLLIFESNQLGKEIYKEKIANKLPEYSYKTVAQIIDEGIIKKFFVNLPPRAHIVKDSKVRNIRPSEDLVIEFINWHIDLISVLSKFQIKYT